MPATVDALLSKIGTGVADPVAFRMIPLTSAVIR